MSDLREAVLAYADLLHRGTDVVPGVDVAWKLRQIANDPNHIPDAAVVNSAVVRLRPSDEDDPYDRVVFVQGHRHSEPVCAEPICQTYLTREQMAAMPEADR